jgi:hypothetical protein
MLVLPYPAWMLAERMHMHHAIRDSAAAHTDLDFAARGGNQRTPWWTVRM